MALQLGQFKPLEHKHYQLAKTQSEYDEDAKRQMAIDDNRAASQEAIATMHEANQNNRANAAITERRRQDATAQGNFESEQAARIEQQGIDNSLRQQQEDRQGQYTAAQIANIGVDNALRQQQEDRLQGADKRQATQFDQEQEARRQAEELKQVPIAMAKFGHYLNMAEPDKNGMIDVTDQKDNIKTMAGGFGDQDFKRITAQNVNNKWQLFGLSDDDKAQPLTRNGNQISIDDGVLKSASLFGASDAKTAKAQAELEQTKLENEQKNAELKYIKENGVKMGTSDRNGNTLSLKDKIGMANELIPIDPVRGDPKGNITKARQVYSTYLSKNPSASVDEALGAATGGNTPATASATGFVTPQKEQALQAGATRRVGGIDFVWDGSGWKKSK